jgi:hypothetical protein
MHAVSTSEGSEKPQSNWAKRKVKTNAKGVVTNVIQIAETSEISKCEKSKGWTSTLNSKTASTALKNAAIDLAKGFVSSSSGQDTTTAVTVNQGWSTRTRVF